jgi:GNAT superfamily N-acetyltransferase
MPETKTTWNLEMSSREDFRPKLIDVPGFEVRQVARPCASFNWFLHQAVGTDFRWGGRHDWGEAEWTEWVNQPELETWVAYVDGAPAGYCEMVEEEDGGIQIHRFGLLPEFLGQGLGGHFLSIVIERAWDRGSNRVWLHTCSLDHPHAMKNYQARGFCVTSEQTGPGNSARRTVLFTSGQPEEV